MKCLWRVGLLSLALASPVYAQQRIEVIEIKSAASAVNIALEENHDLLLSKLSEAKAKADYQSTFSWHLPNISATAVGQRNFDLAATPFPEELGVLLGSPGESVVVQFGTDYNYNAGLNINQSIFDWLAIQQTRIGKTQIDLARAESQALTQNLKELVITSYYTALIAQKAIEVYKEDLLVADTVLKLVKNKFQQGLIDEYGLNKAKINYNAAEMNVGNGNLMFERSLDQLKSLLGLDKDQYLILSGDPNVSLFQIDSSLGTDFNLEVFRKQEKQANQNVQLQIGNHVPKVSFYSYLGKQQFRNDFGMSFNENDWVNYSYAGLNITVPIYSKSSNYTSISSAKINQRSTMLRLEKETIASNLKDHTTVIEYQNSVDIAVNTLKNFRLSERNRQLSLSKYRSGVISLDEHLSTTNDYLKAENGYLNSLLELSKHYSKLMARKPAD